MKAAKGYGSKFKARAQPYWTKARVRGLLRNLADRCDEVGFEPPVGAAVRTALWRSLGYSAQRRATEHLAHALCHAARATAVSPRSQKGHVTSQKGKAPERREPRKR